MIFEDQAQLDKWLGYWQKSLRLQDWSVNASIERDVDMYSSNSAGCCRMTYSLREADIQIQSDLDWHSKKWPLDHEQILVHELLHLCFDPFYPDGEDCLVRKLAEQAIDSIAWALVRERRAASGCKA